MSRIFYTKKMLDFLRENYPKMGKGDLTQSFNKAFGTDKTLLQIKAALNNHKIRCGRTTSQIRKGVITSFTVEQIEFIKQSYQKMTIAELTNAYNAKYNENRSAENIKGFAARQKIYCGRTGYFKKGTVPHNKGIKGWMPGGNAQKSQFKKGQKPINQRPVGSERICSKGGFVMVKVAEPRTWRMKHVIEWEKHNPPLKKGECVTFKDNNPLNWHIDNLMLVTRAQLAVMNKFGLCKAPAELKESARTLADITMKRCQILREQAA